MQRLAGDVNTELRYLLMCLLDFLKDNANSVDGQMFLGLSLHRMGQLTESRAAYETALALKRDTLPAWQVRFLCS